MKWKVRKPEARDRALLWWHVWYAWYPVRVATRGEGGQKMIWLEPVCRRGQYGCVWGEDWNSFDWEYKERVKE
jgi:hypothetical protein